MWNPCTISLLSDFTMHFDMFFGASTCGADGLAFVLQTGGTGTNPGANAAAHGTAGIPNSLSVGFDTYSNTASPYFDAVYDSLILRAGGALGTAAPLSCGDPVNPPDAPTFNAVAGTCGRPQILASSTNAKDNQFHDVQIDWVASTRTLSVTVEGSLRASWSFSATMMADFFGGSSNVYYGFTATTGGSNNFHEVGQTSSTVPVSCGVATLVPTSNVTATPLVASCGTPTNVPSFTITPGNTPYYSPTITPTPFPPGCGPPTLELARNVSQGCINSGSKTMSITVPAGLANSMMLIRVEKGSIAQPPTAVVWNGAEPATLVRADAGYSGTELRTYYILQPSSGTNNLVFTVPDQCGNWNVAVELYSGVNQASPIGGSSTVTGNAQFFNTTITATGAASYFSDFFALAQADTETYTLGAGQTDLKFQNNTALPSGTDITPACCEKIFGDNKISLGTGVKTFSYGLTQSRQYTSQFVEVNGYTVCGTPSFTVTPSESFTFTATRSATPSPSPSRTLTPSATPTSSRTPSGTPTETGSSTPTRTATPSASPSPSPSPTLTMTPSRSATPTASPTFTETSPFSPTNTSTGTPSFTVSPTRTQTVTTTASPTATPSASVTATPTVSPSFTGSPTYSNTASVTATPTPSPSFTGSPTYSNTASVTATPTPTLTFSGSPTFSNTASITSTPTQTPSFTGSPTFSSTPSVSVTPTETLTSSVTDTPTNTPSLTYSPTASETFTVSVTPSITPTITDSPTVSPTPQPVPHHVRILVYNSAGELVKLLFNGAAQYQLGQLLFDRDLVLEGVNKLGITFPGYLYDPAHGQVGNGLVWGADNDNGQLVGGGIYLVKVEIVDNFGQMTTLQRSVQVVRANPENSLTIYNSAGERVVALALPAGVSGTAHFGALRLSTDSVAVEFDEATGAALGTPFTLFVSDDHGVETAVPWDGRNAQGAPVTSGSYTAELVYAPAGGSRQVLTKGFVLLEAGNGASLTKAFAYPNPSRHGEDILVQYVPSLGSRVEAQLYSLAGELVGTAVDPSQSGTLRLPAKSLASGVYAVRLEKKSGTAVLTRVVLKVAVVH